MIIYKILFATALLLQIVTAIDRQYCQAAMQIYFSQSQNAYKHLPQCDKTELENDYNAGVYLCQDPYKINQEEYLKVRCTLDLSEDLEYTHDDGIFRSSTGEEIITNNRDQVKINIDGEIDGLNFCERVCKSIEDPAAIECLSSKPSCYTGGRNSNFDRTLCNATKVAPMPRGCGALTPGKAALCRETHYGNIAVLPRQKAMRRGMMNIPAQRLTEAIVKPIAQPTYTTLDKGTCMNGQWKPHICAYPIEHSGEGIINSAAVLGFHIVIPKIYKENVENFKEGFPLSSVKIPMDTNFPDTLLFETAESIYPSARMIELAKARSGNENDGSIRRAIHRSLVGRAQPIKVNGVANPKDQVDIFQLTGGLRSATLSNAKPRSPLFENRPDPTNSRGQFRLEDITNSMNSKPSKLQMPNNPISTNPRQSQTQIGLSSLLSKSSTKIASSKLRVYPEGSNSETAGTNKHTQVSIGDLLSRPKRDQVSLESLLGPKRNKNLITAPDTQGMQQIKSLPEGSKMQRFTIGSILNSAGSNKDNPDSRLKKDQVNTDLIETFDPTLDGPIVANNHDNFGNEFFPTRPPGFDSQSGVIPVTPHYTEHTNACFDRWGPVYMPKKPLSGVEIPYLKCYKKEVNQLDQQVNEYCNLDQQVFVRVPGGCWVCNGNEIFVAFDNGEFREDKTGKSVFDVLNENIGLNHPRLLEYYKYMQNPDSVPPYVPPPTIQFSGRRKRRSIKNETQKPFHLKEACEGDDKDDYTKLKADIVECQKNIMTCKPADYTYFICSNKKPAMRFCHTSMYTYNAYILEGTGNRAQDWAVATRYRYPQMKGLIKYSELGYLSEMRIENCNSEPMRDFYYIDNACTVHVSTYINIKSKFNIYEVHINDKISNGIVTSSSPAVIQLPSHDVLVAVYCGNYSLHTYLKVAPEKTCTETMTRWHIPYFLAVLYCNAPTISTFLFLVSAVMAILYILVATHLILFLFPMIYLPLWCYFAVIDKWAPRCDSCSQTTHWFYPCSTICQCGSKFSSTWKLKNHFLLAQCQRSVTLAFKKLVKSKSVRIIVAVIVTLSLMEIKSVRAIDEFDMTNLEKTMSDVMRFPHGQEQDVYIEMQEGEGGFSKGQFIFNMPAIQYSYLKFRMIDKQTSTYLGDAFIKLGLVGYKNDYTLSYKTGPTTGYVVDHEEKCTGVCPDLKDFKFNNTDFNRFKKSDTSYWGCEEFGCLAIATGCVWGQCKDIIYPTLGVYEKTTKIDKPLVTLCYLIGKEKGCKTLGGSTTTINKLKIFIETQDTDVLPTPIASYPNGTFIEGSIATLTETGPMCGNLKLLSKGTIVGSGTPQVSLECHAASKKTITLEKCYDNDFSKCSALTPLNPNDHHYFRHNQATSLTLVKSARIGTIRGEFDMGNIKISELEDTTHIEVTGSGTCKGCNNCQRGFSCMVKLTSNKEGACDVQSSNSDISFKTSRVFITKGINNYIITFTANTVATFEIITICKSNKIKLSILLIKDQIFEALSTHYGPVADIYDASCSTSLCHFGNELSSLQTILSQAPMIALNIMYILVALVITFVIIRIVVKYGLNRKVKAHANYYRELKEA